MASKLTDEFTVRMFEIYRHAKEQANYTATIFYSMVHDNGGLITAKSLINAAKPSDGYTALFERDRLDLTVEAVIVEENKWHPLFTEEEIDRAKKRLNKYGYKPK